MLANLGWTLQVVALLLVAAAIPIGVLYDALRAEVGILAAGGALFLVGRWLTARRQP